MRQSWGSHLWARRHLVKVGMDHDIDQPIGEKPITHLNDSPLINTRKQKCMKWNKN